MANSQRCVVLGGNGFLGQRLCQRLVESGFLVRSISRSGRPNGEAERWQSQVEWLAAPMGTESSSKALRDADLLFHLASTTLPATSDANVAYDLESNVSATVRVLEAASRSVRRLIFVSSGGTVYGIARENLISESHPTDPICPHGIHKLAIEKYLQLYRLMKGLDSIVLRVSNIYGESQDCNKPLGAVAHFTARAVNGVPIEIWGDGTTTRDYIHVDDVVCALTRAMWYEGAERLFNIGTGRGVSLCQLVEMLRQQLSQPVKVEYRARRYFDVPENVLDNSRAKRELSWAPQIALELGLERMLRRAQTSPGGGNRVCSVASS